MGKIQPYISQEADVPSVFTAQSHRLTVIAALKYSFRDTLKAFFLFCFALFFRGKTSLIYKKNAVILREKKSYKKKKKKS